MPGLLPRYMGSPEQCHMNIPIYCCNDYNSPMEKICSCFSTQTKFSDLYLHIQLMHLQNENGRQKDPNPAFFFLLSTSGVTMKFSLFNLNTPSDK